MTSISRLFGLFALVGLLALSQAANAQRGPRDPAQRVARQMESLQAAVDLTDAQAVEIRALLDADATDRPERGARGSGNREEMRAQRQAQRAELNSEIESVLTPDQIEPFRTWAASQQQRGRRGGQGGNS